MHASISANDNNQYTHCLVDFWSKNCQIFENIIVVTSILIADKKKVEILSQTDFWGVEIFLKWCDFRPDKFPQQQIIFGSFHKSMPGTRRVSGISTILGLFFVWKQHLSLKRSAWKDFRLEISQHIKPARLHLFSCLPNCYTSHKIRNRLPFKNNGQDLKTPN